eukprot:83272-Rhodomonas_salina.2
MSSPIQTVAYGGHERATSIPPPSVQVPTQPSSYHSTQTVRRHTVCHNASTQGSDNTNSSTQRADNTLCGGLSART